MVRFIFSIILIFTAAIFATECFVDTVQGKIYTVCSVKPDTDSIALFYRDANGCRFKTFSTLRQNLMHKSEVLEFAMNGGMFHPDTNPVGLLICNYQRQGALNHENGNGNFFMKPNGVFLINDKGKPLIIPTDSMVKSIGTIRHATQSGPLLLHNGKIHPVFQEKVNSSNCNRRNGVGIDTNGVVHFVITDSPVNFYEFATFFRNKLLCCNALYLDGVISGIYSEKLNRNDPCSVGPIIGIIHRGQKK